MLDQNVGFFLLLCYLIVMFYILNRTSSAIENIMWVISSFVDTIRMQDPQHIGYSAYLLLSAVFMILKKKIEIAFIY